MKRERNDAPGELTRRDFTRFTLGMISLGMLGYAVPRAARADHHEAGGDDAPELVTDFEVNRLMLLQVQYVPLSTQEGRRCENCTMFWEREGDFGRCALFQKGKVAAGGGCTSWTKKWA